MQKFIILISTLILFFGFGCLSEEEADEVDVSVQGLVVDNQTKSAELTVIVMYLPGQYSKVKE